MCYLSGFSHSAGNQLPVFSMNLFMDYVDCVFITVCYWNVFYCSSLSPEYISYFFYHTLKYKQALKKSLSSYLYHTYNPTQTQG